MKTRIQHSISAIFLLALCLLSPFSFNGFQFAWAQKPVWSSKSATLVNAPSLSSLFDKSSDVLVGNVLAVESRWDEKAAIIFTYSTVQVEQRLKGNLIQSYVTIKQRGGEIGNIGLLVSDEPHFAVGEKVKVFLKNEEAGYFSVVGGIGGKVSLAAPASSGFAYSGIHWTDVDLPVPYYINENGTPDIAGTTNEFDAVRASFQAWEDDSGSFMDYTYVGTTRRTNQTDGYNVVSWHPIDGPSGNLAITNYWYNPSTHEMIEFDIVFDEDETWSVTGEPDKFDIQNVGTHEVGHTLVLEDLYDAADSEQTMYGYCSEGEVKKRTLAVGDVAGIGDIYPMPTPSPVTITITTNPPRLQVEVDGVNYTAPQSFIWGPNTFHNVNVLSLQTVGTSTRYIFSAWSDGGARHHTFTVGTSSITISASFSAQYLATVSSHGLDTVFPAAITFIQAGLSRSAFTSTSWNNWCDAGTSVTVSKYINGEEGKRWLTYDATSWTIDSPFSATVDYILQYRITMKFTANDLTMILRPPFVQILGGTPNSSLLTLETYSDVWLDDVKWTLKNVLWQGSNVLSIYATPVELRPDYEWTVICQVYPVSFQSAFKNSQGSELSEPPSAFILLFPNGTISEQLNPSTIYYMQNGTTVWQSITWQDAEVAPSSISFDVASGNPTVNCRIYDFSIEVSDALGFPVSGVYVSIELQNGRTQIVQTDPDGVAFIRMVPTGEFTAQMSFLTQRIIVAGDVAEAASVPVEVELFWGLSSLALVLSICVLVGTLCAFLVSRRLRHSQRGTMNQRNESNVQQPF